MSNHKNKRTAPNVQLVAATVLRNVIDQGRSLDRALQSEAERLPLERGPRLRELAFGSCRHYAVLDGLLGQMIAKPMRAKDRMVHFLIVIGLYQLEFLRIPDHAAVDETVAALKSSRQSWARGLVNGVLRQYIRERDNGGLAIMRGKLSAARQNGFMPFLYQATVDSWPQQAEQIFAASIERPPLTLRVNRQKTTREEYLRLLASHSLDAALTTESPDGITLAQPLPVTSLPMFNEGWVSVQDESAQLCTAEMQLAPGLDVLDGCAAPGGKSCAMLEAEPSINLTAVDLPERVAAIDENLARLAMQAEVEDSGLYGHHSWSDDRQWQRILLDVPCSGSGVIRRHPDIMHHRHDGDLQRFADQQLDLLVTAWPLLERDGSLLYVTCSIMPEENDGVIGRFIEGRDDVAVQALGAVDGIDTRYGRQRLPGIHPGDGFYYCRLARL